MRKSDKELSGPVTTVKNINQQGEMPIFVDEKERPLVTEPSEQEGVGGELRVMTRADQYGLIGGPDSAAAVMVQPLLNKMEEDAGARRPLPQCKLPSDLSTDG